MTNIEEKKFSFSDENLKEVKKIIAKYPQGREQSAVMPLLYLAQKQNGGWLSQEAMDAVAETLEMAPIRVYEVASFYTMYNTNKVGENFIQICTTTPCMLRGSGDIVEICKKELGIGIGETTKDGQFTITEVECLGACVNAPMIQINDDYYEDLNKDSMAKIIDDIKNGRKVRVGSQKGRMASAPESGLTSLDNASLPIEQSE